MTYPIFNEGRVNIRESDPSLRQRGNQINWCVFLFKNQRDGNSAAVLTYRRPAVQTIPQE
jgi:hypothetical protein